MDTLIAYLLIACLGSILFVGLELLVLRSFASHRQRRHILLLAILTISLLPIAGIFLPLNLPQIRFVYQEQSQQVEEIERHNENSQWLPTLVIGAKQKGERAFDLSKNELLVAMLSLLWTVLCSFYLYRIIKRLKALRRLHLESKTIAHYQGREVRELANKEQNAFSFLGKIYLSKDVWESPQRAYILKHEMAHIQLGHTYDMLLSELLLLPQCFNPFASYLKQALKEVHEFQADELVLCDESIPRKAYQYTLLCFAMQGDYDPICQFFRIPYLYNNQLKKRIIMMKNERKASSKWSYVLALPITALMLWGGNSCSSKKQTKVKEQKPAIETMSPTKPQQVKQAELTQTLPKEHKEARPLPPPPPKQTKQEHPLPPPPPKQEQARAKTKSIVPATVEVENYPDLCTVISTNTNPSQKDLEALDQVDGEIFTVVDTPCQFSGGIKALMAYLSKNIHYPVLAQKKNIEGRVIISFVVTKDGSIRQAKVVRSVDPLLDKEALRVVRTMPKWKAGKLKGKAVNQKFTLPIVYKLGHFPNKKKKTK